MKKLKVAMSCDDVALDGWSTPEHLLELIKFYDKFGLKGTFMVVPVYEDGTYFTKQKEYIAILKDAMEAGHTIGQHGISHDRFEIGIPPQMILDLPNETESKRRVAEEYDSLVAEHTLPKIIDKLTMGKNILEDAFEREVKGFRSPSLQTSDNMWKAFDLVGYTWDSSYALQPTAWDILNGKKDSSFTEFEINPIWKSHKNFETFPLSGEYTWFLPDEDFDLTFALAKHDIDRCSDLGLAFIPVCHVSPINLCPNGNGYKMYEKIIEYIFENYETEINNIGTL
ncbi:MAG: DUF2334 domain-containing protein [Armatimonadetes bacterium]|nr:DUF2334 domain-containing protein [Candidatus Hippobium faecium]